MARPVSGAAAAFLFLPAATSLVGFAFLLGMTSSSDWTFAANLELAVGFLASLALEAGASVVFFAALTIGVGNKQDCAQYMLGKRCSLHQLYLQHQLYKTRGEVGKYGQNKAAATWTT